MFYVAWLVCMCICYDLHVCMGVWESPWNGRPPPERLHPWSTGCVLQAWPPWSHRSDCMESQPSAGAPGIHQPPGPQGGLEETHTHRFMQVCAHAYRPIFSLHVAIHTKYCPTSSNKRAWIPSTCFLLPLKSIKPNKTHWTFSRSITITQAP